MRCGLYEELHANTILICGTICLLLITYIPSLISFDMTVEFQEV